MIRMNSTNIRRSIVLAVAMLAGAALLKLAAHAHLFGADSADRSAQMLIGLELAIFANFIPKNVSASARYRPTLRVSGWVFFIAGLAYAVIWAVAPAGIAFALGMTTVVSAIVVAAGHCLWASNRRASATAS
jgi:hypothetical protein